MKARTPHHLTEDEITRCVSGEMKDDDLLRLYEHLGECEQCAERLRHVRLHHFEFEKWNASTHTAEIHRQYARSAIEQVIASEKPSRTRRRLVEWLERWGGVGEAGALLEFDWDTDQERVRFAICDAISRPRAELCFSTTPRPEGDDRLKVGLQWTGAFKTGSSAWGPAASPPIHTRDAAATADAGQVMIDPAMQSLELTFRTVPRGLQMPLVLLYPGTRQGKIFLSDPKTVSRSSDHRARFDEIPAGKYTLLLSPTDLSLDT